MNSKLLGGVLLVVGTTIGAGMLALPVATAQLGFWGSLILLIGCWAIMTTCAFLFLEVNLWLPAKSNYVSMADATLGKVGKIVAWIAYLLLLYSILSAYIAGGGDLFHFLLQNSGFNIPIVAADILFTVLFGLIVYCGIRSVDYFNRGLMFGKMLALFALIILILPYISSDKLNYGNMQYLTASSNISVTVVAFTCLMIIPSLRTYFEDDIASLKKAIWIGTLIPLVCYILWDMVIMGVIPFKGTSGLQELLHSPNSNSGLVLAIMNVLHKNVISGLAKFFTSICMVTSFLSVSLSLSDFLADGFKVSKKGMGNVFIFSLTFIPPILAVLFYPDAFIRGIQYAGLCCFILMIVFPPLMAWRGRYHHSISQVAYQVWGGKFLLTLLFLFGSLMVGLDIQGAI